MKFNQVCINCFKETKGYDICPHCGCEQSDKPKQLNHLYPFVELNKRYVIGKVINNGGFGVVYKAYDKNLNTVVAIKELFPTQNSMVTRVPGTKNVITYKGEKGKQFATQKARFLEEARTMSKLSACESIVDVYDFFEENETVYLVMEFLDGLTLRDYMNSFPEALSFKDTMDIIEPVIKALIATHKENIIHCDVSPDNVFITEGGKIKLIDFGAAKLTDDEKEKSIAIVAKPGYTPPEQYRSKAKIKPYTDVYATAAMMYRMLTNTLPEESIDRLEKDELERPTKLGAKIPPQAEKSIMKAMALDENARFKNMSDFLLALQGKKKADFPEKELKKKRIIRWVSFASVLVLAGGAITGGLIYKNSKGIIPPSGEHTINVWLTNADQSDKFKDDTKWDVISNDYFKEFLGNQDEDVNIKVNIEYINETEYAKKFEEAAVKPDIFRSDLINNSEQYSADISNLYSEIDDNKKMTTVYDAMKSKYQSTNEFAVYYDTIVTYGYLSETADKNSIYSYTHKNKKNKDKLYTLQDSMVINPEMFWRLSDKMGYIKNDNADDASKLANYVNKNAMRKLTGKEDTFYVGAFSENNNLMNNSGNEMFTYSFSTLPGDSNYYSFFPERFAVSNDSSSENKKASMLYLYFLCTSDDVQYNVIRKSSKSYLSMLESTVESVKKNDKGKKLLNLESLIYDKMSSNITMEIDDTSKINAETEKLKNNANGNGDVKIDSAKMSELISDIKK